MASGAGAGACRYDLLEEIASGGMASVHLARASGDGGFTRIVAVKRPHAHIASAPEVAATLVDEARLAARVRHRNVVPVIDVVEGEPLSIVMEYVHGMSLAWLLETARPRNLRPHPRVVATMLVGVLRGLDAAHEATNERGEPLELVHRDVSPQNVIVDAFGVARVLDFGIAKARGRLHTTRDGTLKGKLAYMAPELLRRRAATRRTDVYAAAVVLWEALTSRRLFEADSEAETVAQVLRGGAPPPSSVAHDIPAALDVVVARGLARDPARRFATAREMADALQHAIEPAPESEVAAWVDRVAGDVLRKRDRALQDIDEATRPGADARACASRRPRPLRRLARPLVTGALLAVAVVVLVRASATTAASREGSPEHVSAGAEPGDTEPAAQEPPTDEMLVVPSPPAPGTSRSGEAPPRSEPRIDAPPARARTRRPAPRSTPSTRKDDSCDPPSFVDEHGRTRYKRWCPL